MIADRYIGSINVLYAEDAERYGDGEIRRGVVGSRPRKSERGRACLCVCV